MTIIIITLILQINGFHYDILLPSGEPHCDPGVGGQGGIQSTSDTSQIPANSEDEMWLDQPSG
jgi:hypothetical protein